MNPGPPGRHVTGDAWPAKETRQPHAKQREMLAAYRDNGGRGKAVLQVHLCWAPQEEDAVSVALDQWRSNVFAPPVPWDLPTAAHFDGVSADVGGLIQRVDYLAALGVTCIWLMPFYPSPDRDDGYELTDMYGVDPRLGTMGDVVEFIRTAKDRGMRVIADFVINHTSDQHPWFKESRKSVDNPFRDYYVWRKGTPPGTSDQVVFPGEETSVWTRDKATGEWYLHMFSKHQPDLNVANPKVRDEIAKSMGFWLQLGLDGFRLDAVPFFLELQGVSKEEAGKIDPHDYQRPSPAGRPSTRTTSGPCSSATTMS